MLNRRQFLLSALRTSAGALLTVIGVKAVSGDSGAVRGGETAVEPVANVASTTLPKVTWNNINGSPELAECQQATLIQAQIRAQQLSCEEQARLIEETQKDLLLHQWENRGYAPHDREWLTSHTFTDADYCHSQMHQVLMRDDDIPETLVHPCDRTGGLG